MFNILIADDNINYAISLMNYINQTNKNIKVCNISKDGKETLETLNKKNSIDVALLDYKMPVYNAQQILEKIENKNKYNNSVILISGEIQSISSFKESNMIHSVIFKTCGFEYITKELNMLINEKKEQIINKNYQRLITNELLYLGYNISHKGTQYLIKVINYIALNPNKELENLEKNVYPQIAKIYNSSVHNIKCRINSATTTMYYNCEIEKLKKYFNFYIDTKPRIKTIITTVLNKILQ